MYTNNKLFGNQNYPIYNSNKNNKIGMNLTKQVRDMYTENHKILIKVIEGDTNKWTDIPCS